MGTKHQQRLRTTAIGFALIAALLVLIGPLFSQGKDHVSPAFYHLPDPIECHLAYRSSDAVGWKNKTLTLKAQYAETLPQHEERAVFTDLSVHCSYTASPNYPPTVLVEVFDTHTSKQISATEYVVNRKT